MRRIPAEENSFSPVARSPRPTDRRVLPAEVLGPPRDGASSLLGRERSARAPSALPDRGCRSGRPPASRLRLGPPTQRPRRPFCTMYLLPGRVAELVDAQDSGSCEGNLMGVQVPPRPQRRYATFTVSQPLATVSFASASATSAPQGEYFKDLGGNTLSVGARSRGGSLASRPGASGFGVPPSVLAITPLSPLRPPSFEVTRDVIVGEECFHRSPGLVRPSPTGAEDRVPRARRLPPARKRDANGLRRHTGIVRTMPR